LSFEFLRGFIFYAPQNEFTDDIMQRVTNRMETIKFAETAIDEFLGIVHQTKHFFSNNTADITNLVVCDFSCKLFG